MENEDIGLIVVAGGSGTRMGSAVPKQFLPLAGYPVLGHVLRRFEAALPGADLVVVVSEGEMDRWKALCEKYGMPVHRLVRGGKDRFHSVKNGLEALKPSCRRVGVHDGVRPLVGERVIHNALKALSIHPAVVPAVPVVDSLRLVDQGNSRSVDRSLYRAVQTPQFFDRSVLSTAYQQDFNPLFTDDASVVEAAGIEVFLSEGDPANLKITTPVDLAVAEVLLRKEPCPGL